MKTLRMSMIAAMALSAASLISTAASAGCARWGETGYHFYRSCYGPSFLYPHHRQCHNGICIYH